MCLAPSDFFVIIKFNEWIRYFLEESGDAIKVNISFMNFSKLLQDVYLQKHITSSKFLIILHKRKIENIFIFLERENKLL